MATHSSVLAWRIPGAVEPDGLPSMGSHRVGHDWSDLAAAAAAPWSKTALGLTWIIVLLLCFPCSSSSKQSHSHEVKPFSSKFSNSVWWKHNLFDDLAKSVGPTTLIFFSDLISHFFLFCSFYSNYIRFHAVLWIHWTATVIPSAGDDLISDIHRSIFTFFRSLSNTMSQRLLQTTLNEHPTYILHPLILLNRLYCFSPSFVLHTKYFSLVSHPIPPKM